LKAMQLDAIQPIEAAGRPLSLVDCDIPSPGHGEALLRVIACGVCHTELDEIEGRTPPPRLPVIPGHQVVAEVAELGGGVSRLSIGQRVGVGWIGGACGHCDACATGHENLCPDFIATGRDIHGGYAQYMTVDAGFAHPIPDAIDSLQAAPMLCAGAIGYRSLALANLRDGQAVGLTGFGGSGHLVLQMIRHRYPASPVYVFARRQPERAFALDLGADWAGDTTDRAPSTMAAIIDTTPAWLPIVAALEQLSPAGRIVINAIRKEDADKARLLDIDYPRHLWLEKEIKSVANVTRRDIGEFLDLAAAAGIAPEIECYSLGEANRALVELKHHHIRGAKVLDIAGGS
jgi:propanol-preferring alcohol dehydrogenase